MNYSNIKKGVFVSRPNRFIAHVLVDGQIEICHVKNTGRCKEILCPDTNVVVHRAENPNRKTKFDLIAAYKQDMLINIDSQAPNHIFMEAVQSGKLFQGYQEIKREVVYKNSRFDFWIKDKEGKENFIEIKGVTLELDGKAYFPDAPTERGIKHIHELMDAKKEGYGAYLFFLIQLKGVASFSPNNWTHPAFGRALKDAQEAGVAVTLMIAW